MLGSTIKVVVTDAEGNVIGEDETAEVEKAPIKLLEAKQTKSNEIRLTFDSDVSDIEKEEIIVSDEDGTLEIPINKITVLEDGVTVDVTLAAALSDGHTYDVKYDESTVMFEASIGEVASVVITTENAEVNTKTPIKFVLYNKDKVDITASKNIDATCIVSVDGTATYDTSRASKASITMTTEGETATVTVTYNSGKSGAKPIENTAVITCVPAEAAIGDKLYARSSDVEINANSKCAKFYKVTSLADAVSVPVDGLVDDLYFCVVDPETGSAIAYDTYEVESSNDDVASANALVDTGKFAQISVSGNTLGEANVVVVATKNGASATYTIPVEVVETGVLTRITAVASLPTITNAIDDEYSGSITVTAYDAENNKITKNISTSFELVNKENKAGKVEPKLKALFEANPALAKGFQLSETAGTYTAYGAVGEAQNVKVKVSQNDIVKEVPVSITIDALPDTAWNVDANATATKPNITYAIDLKDSSIDEASTTTTTVAKLKAMIGSSFAGYVRDVAADAGKNVTIGKTGLVAGNDTITGSKAVGYVKAKDGYVKIESAAEGPALNKITYDGTKALGVTEVAATVAGDYEWAEMQDATTAAKAGHTWTKTTDATNFAPTTDDVYTLSAASTNTVKVYEKAAKIDAPDDAHYVLVKDADNSIVAPDQAAGEMGFLAGSIVYATNKVKVISSGDTYTKVGAAYKKDTTPSYGANHWVLVAKADGAVQSPNATQTGTPKVDDTTSYNWAADTKTLDIKTSSEITMEALKTALTGPMGGWTITTQTDAPSDVALSNNVGWKDGIANVTVPKSIIRMTDESVIQNVKAGVRYGTKYSRTGNLYNSGATMTTTKKSELTARADGSKLNIATLNPTGNKFYVSGDSDKDGYFAKPGAYTVIFTYADIRGKDGEATTNLTVKNSQYIPKVTVTSRIADSLTMSDIRKVLIASVDMNNNNSDYYSILDTNGFSAVSATGVATPATVLNNRLTIKYVGVVETLNGVAVTYYIPINATFKTE